MTVEERWAYLVTLDEELLKGGVVLSEKCAFLVRNVDLAFVHEAPLAAILTAVAAIETQLRAEHSGARVRLIDLVNTSDLASEVKGEIHSLRRFRNEWVHVDEPWEDDAFLKAPELAEQQLLEMARRAVVVLRRVVYHNPWI